MPRAKRNLGEEILDGIREIKSASTAALRHYQLFRRFVCGPACLKLGLRSFSASR